MKKFEDLSAEEQGMLNEYAAKNQHFLGNFSRLMETGCVLCKKKFLRWPEMAAHIHQTHGILEELLVEMMGYNKWLTS